MLHRAAETRNSLSRNRKYGIICGWLFIMPLMTGLILFVAFPLVYAVILSVCNYNLFAPPVFVGLDNFKKIFSDTFFIKSMGNALLYCLNIPVRILLALIIANILAGKIRGSATFRLIYYVPTVFGAVAIIFIWQWMFAQEYGMLYQLMKKIGLNTINFLDRKHFMSSMIMLSVWCSFGVSLLLLFATIKNVPKCYFEEAELDGANSFQRLIHITVPFVSSLLFYLVLTGIIGSFQEFTLFNVMAGDSVNEYNIMPVWWIYKFTGQYGYEYGYASALGVALGVLLIIVSLIQFKLSDKFVFYS